MSEPDSVLEPCSTSAVAHAEPIKRLLHTMGLSYTLIFSLIYLAPTVQGSLDPSVFLFCWV